MPVHQTGFSGQAVVPCSHCNSNDQGPEAGICHRHVFQDGRACYDCQSAANGGQLAGHIERTVLWVVGQLNQVPCSHCDGKGYRKI